MLVQHHPIKFDIEQVTTEEVPFLNTFYRHKGELDQDIRDLLDFPVKNQEAMPFYTVKESTTFKLNEQFEAYYAMMVDALKIAFEDRKLMDKFFDCQFWREHGDRFRPYAYTTFLEKHPALYGRYDACFDPETEELKGVYEFNGDTPVMLFESVNLQARLSEQLGTDQYNNYWDIFIETMKGRGYRNIAVVCGTDYVEDMATCETVAQAFRSALPNAVVQFLDLKELDFDHANISKPWVGKEDETPFDAIYVLSPWEEMIETFPEMLDHWARWVDNVHLFEPAWRWFLAHKGMTALCYELIQVNYEFRNKHMCHGGRVLIPTWLESEAQKYPTIRHQKLVQKPVIGRLSNNIRVWDIEGDEIVCQNDTGGYYSEENTVFQKYVAPGKVEGRNNFILGMWMCGSHAASLCAREFDTEVLSISNERWIPHIVVEG
ncbi:putative acid--amine ligase YgiC [compost metagenome]